MSLIKMRVGMRILTKFPTAILSSIIQKEILSVRTVRSTDGLQCTGKVYVLLKPSIYLNKRLPS